jgi:hypothetical protein
MNYYEKYDIHKIWNDNEEKYIKLMWKMKETDEFEFRVVDFKTNKFNFGHHIIVFFYNNKHLYIFFKGTCCIDNWKASLNPYVKKSKHNITAHNSHFKCHLLSKNIFNEILDKYNDMEILSIYGHSSGATHVCLILSSDNLHINENVIINCTLYGNPRFMNKLTLRKVKKNAIHLKIVK